MKMFNCEIHQLGEIATVGKNLMLDQLFRDNVITTQQHAEYAKNYAVIVSKPTIFHRVWAKILQDPEAEIYMLVKNLSLFEDKKEEVDHNKLVLLKRPEVVEPVNGDV